MMMMEKPFADVKRQRFQGRHRGLHGHTGRRSCECATCREQLSGEELQRSHEAKYARGIVPNVEAGEYGYGKRSSPLVKEFLLTEFEQDGLDCTFSLNRAMAWKSVREALEKHSVALPVTSKRPDGKTDTAYVLEATAALLPEPEVVAAAKALETEIYRVGARDIKLVVRLALDPPEGVDNDLIKATLRCSACRVPQTAVVRCNQATAAWDVAASRGKPLDIDLGSTHTLTAFSTQGRHPCTRVFPHRHYSQETRRYHLERKDVLLEQHVFTDSTGSEHYKGPHWTVMVTESDMGLVSEIRDVRSRRWLEPSYVSRYELQWRADGGRKWNSLGCFKGNADATTEVAHSLASFKGLRARYLRVIPLDVENGGAMRVGIYGKPSPGHQMSKGGTKAGSPADTAADEETQLVTYTLTTVPEARSRKYFVDGRSPCGGGRREWYGTSQPSAARLRRRLRARHELTEHTEHTGAANDVDGD